MGSNQCQEVAAYAGRSSQLHADDGETSDSPGRSWGALHDLDDREETEIASEFVFSAARVPALKIDGSRSPARAITSHGLIRTARCWTCPFWTVRPGAGPSSRVRLRNP